MTETQMKPKSDLAVRAMSAVVMVALAIAAIWQGGCAFMAMVVLIALGVLFEFVQLVLRFQGGLIGRIFWIGGGVIYVGVACFAMLRLSPVFSGLLPAITLIAAVIGTDIGAYFAGRTFGGPKIAPKISPSKTWSGLIGGMVGAGLFMNAANAVHSWATVETVDASIQDHWIAVYDWYWLFAAGAIVAAIAQSGDFFESWMKRRAGVKDSGKLIPGHGGLFDRTDGFIAVLFVVGLLYFTTTDFSNFALTPSP